MNTNKRIYQLDLLRFIAALFVVFYHYFFRGYSSDNRSNLNFSEIADFFKYGYLGVNLFFIISGFVIILSVKHKSISKFFISRISRLYPIYWMSVCLTFLTILLFGSPRYSAQFHQFIINLTMFQNYADVQSLDGVYWTLFVEMKFYIFIIGTYLILNKVKQINLDKLVIVWTLLSISYLLLSDFYLMRFINNFLILNWSSYFIAGIIYYQIFTKGISIKYLTLLLFSFLLSLNQAFSQIEGLEIMFNTTFSTIIIGIIIVSFYSILLMVSTNKLNRFNYSKLTSLGMLTYPLYLIHQNIGYILANNLESYFNKYVLIFSIVIIMIFVSYLLSKFYEPLTSNYLKTRLESLVKKIN